MNCILSPDLIRLLVMLLTDQFFAVRDLTWLIRCSDELDTSTVIRSVGLLRFLKPKQLRFFPKPMGTEIAVFGAR